MNYDNGGGLSPSDVALLQNRNNDGFGSFGGDGAWWIILFLLFGLGGWGGGFGGGGFGGFGGFNEYAWLSNGQKEIMQNTNNGFNTLQLGNQLNDISNSVQNINTQLCNGFAGVNATVNSGFANAETAANSRQMANMQQAFSNQLSTVQGFNNLGSQFADCCCENRLGIANLNSTILAENCADRAALQEGVRDIISANQNNTQSILDKLCQLELDGFKRENDQLRSQLQFANMQASQVQQTADLRASQATTANQLVSELRSCPIPAQPVYGNTPIFQCNGNNGYGCGCNGNF